MKKLFLAFALFAIGTVANAQLKTPAPSPAQNVKQDFGLSSIELAYCRPVMKGRKIFGDLVPFGNVWRTGANAATTLTFGDEVTIGGKKIPAGKYGLLTIPDKNLWTIIISKQTNVNSPSLYKPEEDVVRVTAKPVALPISVESFTISFHDIKPESCKIYIAWDKTAVSFSVTTDVDSKVMASIDAAMKSEKPPYFQAAAYYLENNKDIKKANEWFAKAVELNPNAYWVWYQQAKGLAKAGKKTEARAAAQKSRQLAVEGKNNDYVTLNDKLLAELK